MPASPALRKASLPALLGGTPALAGAPPPHRSIGLEEEQAALRVLRSGTLSAFFGSAGPNFLGGPEVRRFEAAWSERFEIPHAVSMNSATSGLIAAIGACGAGPGDEIVVPPFTMSATATAARVWGATPVFADVRPDTFTLDPASVARNLSERTRAIVAVNLLGQPADLDELRALAASRGARLVEDNAQAPGALYKGRWAGTLADIGVFSLNCHKTIQTGEGGVCCTRDADLALRLQLIRNHGEAVVREIGYADRAEQLIGFNFRMCELEAAIGVEQLRKLDRLTAPRVRIAEALRERLAALSGLTPPVVGPDRTHVYYVHALRLDPSAAGLSRRTLVRALAAEGLDCFEGYCRPLYLEPLYRGTWPGKGGRRYESGLCPVAEDLYERSLFYHALLYPEAEPLVPAVCEAFEKIFDNRQALAALADDGARAERRR
jgi:dTDP-4-amino-4,6-dideoxygalactose transaminase